MAESIQGGCLCGAIRYEISFPPGSNYPPLSHTCQCTDCRKQSGSLMLHYVDIPPSDVTWTSDIKPTFYCATPGRKRGFCPKCGSCISWKDESAPQFQEIMSGTIDEQYLTGQKGKELTTVVNQAWCCRFIEGVTDIIPHGKKWEKGGDSRLIE